MRLAPRVIPPVAIVTVLACVGLALAPVAFRGHGPPWQAEEASAVVDAFSERLPPSAELLEWKMRRRFVDAYVRDGEAQHRLYGLRYDSQTGRVTRFVARPYGGRRLQDVVFRFSVVSASALKSALRAASSSTGRVDPLGVSLTSPARSDGRPLWLITTTAGVARVTADGRRLIGFAPGT